MSEVIFIVTATTTGYEVRLNSAPFLGLVLLIALVFFGVSLVVRGLDR